MVSVGERSAFVVPGCPYFQLQPIDYMLLREECITWEPSCDCTFFLFLLLVEHMNYGLGSGWHVSLASGLYSTLCHPKSVLCQRKLPQFCWPNGTNSNALQLIGMCLLLTSELESRLCICGHCTGQVLWAWKLTCQTFQTHLDKTIRQPFLNLQFDWWG